MAATGGVSGTIGDLTKRYTEGRAEQDFELRTVIPAMLLPQRMYQKVSQEARNRCQGALRFSN